ncbi:MAG: hypothetical protein ACLSAC_03850 [Enterocloster bolteae]
MEGIYMNLCDYNVPYQINLKDAVNKGLLVPFHYYGILDETVDYSGIHMVKGRYDEEELTRESGQQTVRFNLQALYEIPLKKGVRFCCSRKHAEQMAKEFCRSGISRRPQCTAIQTVNTLERGALQIENSGW